MDNLALIEKIDQQLADNVDAPRRAHLQIQAVMDNHREAAQLRQAKAESQSEDDEVNSNGRS